jgi:hypothetical protein
MEFDKAIPDTRMQPVATVVGLYRGTLSGLEPLTRDTPLTLDEVRRNPIFFELDLNPDLEDTDLIIDVCYDNLTPLWLQDLERGTAGGSIPGRRVPIRSVSAQPAGRLGRGECVGISARQTTATRARSSNSR